MQRLMPNAPSSAIRRPAADLIEEVLENMRRYLEPLKYSVLAPSRYIVYLHPDEIARLQGILPLLRAQTERALSEEMTRLNRGSMVTRCVDRVLGRDRPPVENAEGEWHVEFLADPDGEVAPGDILVDSELLLPARPELGVGQRTRRITTVRMGQRVTTRERTDNRPIEVPPLPEPRALARLVFEDQWGRQSHDVVKHSVTIGRGGTTYPVDVRIVSSPDVSREHARIRRDPESGHFFLIDLSSLGTSLNGRPISRGYDDMDGSKRENGHETPLPDGARIGLADTVFMDFQIVP
jgi:hypothetical protein